MNFFFKSLAVASVFLMPITGFTAEKVTQVKSESFGSYELNVGDYSKLQEHHYLPENGVATIEIKSGDVFSITLPTNATTGYSWALRTLPAGVMLLDINNHRSDECKGGKVGCGGVTSYTFKAVEKGTGTVSFWYGRSWVNEDSTQKAVTISVK